MRSRMMTMPRAGGMTRAARWWAMGLCAALGASARPYILEDDFGHTLWNAHLRDGVWKGAYESDKQQRHPPRPRRLLMRGLFNTGTNLMQQLIERNLRATVYNYWPRARQKNLASTPHPVPYGCHKHTPLRLISPAVIDPLFVQDAWLSVVMVRHPVQWLASMRKAHYDFFCADWCNLTACRQEVWRQSMLCAMPAGSLRFGRLEDAWMDWAAALMRWRAPHVVVRYEDVLLRPYAVLKSVASAANASFVPEHATEATLALVERAAKAHGGATGRQPKLAELEAARIETLLVDGNVQAASCLPELRHVQRPGLLPPSKLPAGALPAAATASSSRDAGAHKPAKPKPNVLPELDTTARARGREVAAQVSEHILARIAANPTLQELCHTLGYVCTPDARLRRAQPWAMARALSGRALALASAPETQPSLATIARKPLAAGKLPHAGSTSRYS